MAYALLTENLERKARDEMDGMLAEPYLDELPEGLVRERERARRMARSMGIDTQQATALEVMGMTRA